MGYRLVLRRFQYERRAQSGQKLAYTSWWENQGVAPCYLPYRVALRLKGPRSSLILLSDADVRSWLPGDNIADGSVVVPASTPPGDYDLQIAIVGIDPEGWYGLGQIGLR